MCSFIIASFANGCTTRNFTNAEETKNSALPEPPPTSLLLQKETQSCDLFKVRKVGSFDTSPDNLSINL